MGNLYTSTTFMEHNSHPDYKYEMDAPTHEHDGINPSCGDDITLDQDASIDTTGMENMEVDFS